MYENSQTECINITSMVTRIATFENNRTKGMFTNLLIFQNYELSYLRIHFLCLYLSRDKDNETIL